MRLPLQRVRAAARRGLPLATTYVGSGGSAWMVGVGSREPSIAAYLGGDDVHPDDSTRVWSRRIPRHAERVAAAGGVPVLGPSAPEAARRALAGRAITVPVLVAIHTDLPGDVETLRERLRTSTTKEDLRRIRRAGFEHRVVSDPGVTREFHERHYAPLVARQFPDDGEVGSVDGFLAMAGELVCADLDGEWVAGILNVAEETSYALFALGIRDADEGVRQKRVVAALVVRSLERAVELGYARATLGRSLPFLGKGPVWFKAKWGGVLSVPPDTLELQLLLDLRQPAARRVLATSPVLHLLDGALVVSSWLEPGEQALRATVREAGRTAGVARWYVVGRPDTLAAGGEELAGHERLVPVPVTPGGPRPLWLGEALTGMLSPPRPGRRSRPPAGG